MVGFRKIIIRKKTFRDIVLLFLSGVISRVFLNLWFFKIYGPHAVKNIELWLYYGVSTGTHMTGHKGSDPTSWLLTFLGNSFSKDALFYSITASAIILTVFTSFLIYLIVRKLYENQDTALAAGLIYSFMLEPLSLSISGFTHDHIVFPVMLLILYFFIRGWETKSIIHKISYLSLSVILLYFGKHINLGIFVVIGIIAVYAGGKLISGKPWAYPYYICVFLVLGLFFGLCFLPTFMDYQLGKLAQGRMGSGDVRPISLPTFWLRNNIHLFLAPIGLLIAYRKRENISLSFTVFGVLFALTMDRGTRISDIGFSMLSAITITNKNSINKKTATLLIVAFLVLGFYLSFDLSEKVIILLSGLIVLIHLKKNPIGWRFIILILCASGLLLSVMGIYNYPKLVGTEDEYLLYSDDLWKISGDRYILPWDRGFMMETLSGKKALSSPAKIDFIAHDIFWMTEKQAVQYLNILGADHLIYYDDSFSTVMMGMNPHYLISGSLVLNPKNIPNIRISPNLLAYKLSEGSYNKNYFEKIHERKDVIKNRTIEVYKIKTVEKLKTPVGVIIENYDQKNTTGIIEIEYNTIESEEKTSFNLFNPFSYTNCFWRVAKIIILILSFVGCWLYLKNKSKIGKRKWDILFFICLAYISFLIFTPLIPGCELCSEDAAFEGKVFIKNYEISAIGGIEEYVFDAGDIPLISNCSAKIRPIENESWGHNGAVNFINNCSDDIEVKVVLFDKTASNYVGKPHVEQEKIVKLKASQGEFVEFSFKKKNPTHEYQVGYLKPDCVRAEGNDSMIPKDVGLELKYISCPNTHTREDYLSIN